MATCKKITVSLPADLVETVDLIASHLGMTRSAFIALTLSEPVEALGELIRQVQPLSGAPDQAELLRFRGKSAELAQARLDKAQSALNDLLSGC